MITTKRVRKQNERGFTLFVAVITSALVLAMGMSILNVTLKEFLLSGTARDSEMAFYAADAGMECVKYWDQAKAPQGGKFNIGVAPSSITCMGTSLTPSYTGNGGTLDAGDIGTFQFEFGGTGGFPAVCTMVEMTKYDENTDGSGLGRADCPTGAICTQVKSNGYNRGCGSPLNDPHTVERSLRSRY